MDENNIIKALREVAEDYEKQLDRIILNTFHMDTKLYEAKRDLEIKIRTIKEMMERFKKLS